MVANKPGQVPAPSRQLASKHRHSHLDPLKILRKLHQCRACALQELYAPRPIHRPGPSISRGKERFRRLILLSYILISSSINSDHDSYPVCTPSSPAAAHPGSCCVKGREKKL